MPGRRIRVDARWIVVLTAIALIWGVTRAPRHEALAADAADPAPPLPGLTLSFAAAAAPSDSPADARDARLVALRVPAGERATPRLPPGPFVARFGGFIHSRIRDNRLFAAEGNGDLIVVLNGNIVLQRHGLFDRSAGDSVRLKKGDNALLVTYTSPAAGDANLRLLWADKPGPLDPIPPLVFRHDPSDSLLVKAGLARTGRILLATQHCFACHQGSPTGNAAMPELKQDAPNLDHLGDRLNADWVAAWITNPRALRPTATMPRVFHEVPAATSPSVDPRAADLAAYLTEGANPAPETTASDPTTVARGGRLFTSLGCIACHVPGGIDDSDGALQRVPLKFVKSKFKPAALVEFLQKPEAHYAWIKMPNFHLAHDEAAAVASFLWARSDEHALPAAAKGNAARGKELFVAAGCVQCHAPAPAKPARQIPLDHADLTRGCTAANLASIASGVDYGFSAGQRDAIAAAISATHSLETMANDIAPEFATRQMTLLRCNACHAIDAQDSVWSTLDQDVSQIEKSLAIRPAGQSEPAGDQSPPALTWVGEKLRPSWMQSFIAGEVPYKPRQWLLARMPAFATRAQGLTVGLSLMHGVAADDDVRASADEKLANIGRSLTSRTSFGCVACHGVGDQPPLAPFEAPAPNYAHVSDRLRHDYYIRWMRHPQSYIPGTKMPQFGDADGKTAYKNILNGDADQQYQAIWNYLLAGAKIVPPS